MALIQLSEKLQSGKVYTFRYQLQQIWAPSESTLAAHLQRAYSFVSGVEVSRGLTQGTYIISFTWTGLPANAGDVANNILQILSQDADLQFVSAESGKASAPSLFPSLPSPTVIVLIIGGVIVLAIFAGAFGKGLAGRVI